MEGREGREIMICPKRVFWIRQCGLIDFQTLRVLVSSKEERLKSILQTAYSNSEM